MEEAVGWWWWWGGGGRGGGRNYYFSKQLLKRKIKQKLKKRKNQSQVLILQLQAHTGFPCWSTWLGRNSVLTVLPCVFASITLNWWCALLICPNLKPGWISFFLLQGQSHNAQSGESFIHFFPRSPSKQTLKRDHMIQNRKNLKRKEGWNSPYIRPSDYLPANGSLNPPATTHGCHSKPA